MNERVRAIIDEARKVTRRNGWSCSTFLKLPMPATREMAHRRRSKPRGLRRSGSALRVARGESVSVDYEEGMARARRLFDKTCDASR
jgi:hypothetical protein